MAPNGSNRLRSLVTSFPSRCRDAPIDFYPSLVWCLDTLASARLSQIRAENATRRRQRLRLQLLPAPCLFASRGSLVGREGNAGSRDPCARGLWLLIKGGLHAYCILIRVRY